MSTTTSNPFANVARFAKQANPGEQLEAELAGRGRSDILNIGLAALGAGVAARGVTGLFNMARRKLRPARATYPGALVTDVPIPVEEEKTAIYTDKTSFPWYYPAAFLATGLGAMGGWKGMDALMNHRRKTEQNQEMEDARGDFESALLDSYGQPRKVVKTAGEELGQLLDQLYDSLQQEKAAGTWDDLAGKLGGGYLGFYALPTALIAGAAAYSRGQKNSDRAVLDKAMALRQRRAYMSRPSEMLAIARPVPSRHGPDPDEEAAALESAGQETAEQATSPSVDIGNLPERRRKIGF